MSLGTWRFFLAFLVAISHLWSGMIHGPAAYAVWGFFVLSGYLMTYVLSTKYGFSLTGLLAYARNRFLRIYPAYYFLCFLGALTLVFLPKYGIIPSTLNPQFHEPKSWADYWFNITLIPLFGGGDLWVPVSNALAVEIGVYILIPFMAVSRSTAWLGLLLSFLINAHFGFTTNFALRYSHFLTAFMAFGIGSLTCHYRQSLRAIALSGISVLAWCMHGLIWLWYDAWPWTYGLYVSVLLSAWVVVSLAEEKAGALDKWLGDLSYPLYLVHTTAAAWVLLFYKTDRTNFLFFIVSFAVTLLLSWFIVVVIDKPLDRLKYRPRT